MLRCNPGLPQPFSHLLGGSAPISRRFHVAPQHDALYQNCNAARPFVGSRAPGTTRWINRGLTVDMPAEWLHAPVLSVLFGPTFCA